MVAFKKIEKRGNVVSLPLPPTATGSLPSAADDKEATWQPPVFPLNLTHLASLPTVADDKGSPHLPTVVDAKPLWALTPN